MGRRRRGAPDKDFTFVSPIVKYLLFIFNFIFWVSICLSFSAFFIYPCVCARARACIIWTSYWLTSMLCPLKRKKIISREGKELTGFVGGEGVTHILHSLTSNRLRKFHQFVSCVLRTSLATKFTNFSQCTRHKEWEVRVLVSVPTQLPDTLIGLCADRSGTSLHKSPCWLECGDTGLLFHYE